MYAVGHRVLGADGRRMAAQLAGGERAALCCQTAGDFAGIKLNSSGTVHIWVPDQRGRKLSGIVAHWFGDMLETDIEVVNGIRTTSPMRRAGPDGREHPGSARCSRCTRGRRLP